MERQWKYDSPKRPARTGAVVMALIGLSMLLVLVGGLRPARAEGPGVFFHDQPAGPAVASPSGGPLLARSAKDEAELQRKWDQMSPDQRQEYRRRLKRFKELPAQDRQLLRRRHEQLQQLSPQDRRRLQRQLERWDNLSPEERDRIKNRFHNFLHYPGPNLRPRLAG